MQLKSLFLDPFEVGIVQSPFFEVAQWYESAKLASTAFRIWGVKVEF